MSRGRHSEVYRGRFNGKHVAIKVLLPETHSSLKHINASLGEIKLMAILNHECAVRFIRVAWDSLTDLKSRNILLTSKLEAKIADFGICRERSDLMMTGGVGTCLWMAPEVVMGERYDDKANIFSSGVVLSELDSHCLPYAHATVGSFCERHLPDAAVTQMASAGTLRVQFSSSASSAMVALGNACVSLDPANRPTAAEVLYNLPLVRTEIRASARW